ncbi:AAA family ATPase [Methylomarinum vadi]|uniref:AAA family ATPase n=1 Tax=Methylomarinum vadi TaxID=438855 RepID=UPI0004DF6BB9|nr:AAA family ATPase [Methylomarinum vadi]
MKELLNYRIVKSLGASMHAEVYKAFPHGQRNDPVVVKRINNRFSNDELAAYLIQQVEHLTELGLQDVPVPTVLQADSEILCLLQPWWEGQTLTQWLQDNAAPGLEAILGIMLSLCAQIELRHRAGHIHKSIKPSNILLDSVSLQVQIIDDVRVLDINQISHFIYHDHFRSQTLPYLSPEQTGRIKYSVTYSTDLYSLGMIFYALLVGKPPFLFKDPIAIIHSHLAETPTPVNRVNPAVPKMLSNIVTQLLVKAPEKRYQTASGLAADIQQCLEDWRQHRHISRFTLKQKDYSNRITIPSLMVGRDQEKKLLLEEFNKACSGVFRAALISGLSGIGKTRLIQELQLPIVSHAGYFCSGKFDQFKKHIPYSTLIQALTGLIKTFLTEDDERIRYWNSRISAQLGENAQLMIDLLPELELIIGPQPPVADLPPVEARNRFNDVAGKLIAALASQEHPVTLFIDDLQWCDGATFDLLERLFDNPLDYPYLFWIGAYRHNEVDGSHRLTALINKIRQKNRPLQEIRLHALGLPEVNLMTAYILNTYPSRTEALAEVIFQTSGGNPLFVNESLRWLHDYRHLHLAEDGVWVWDEAQLRHTDMPESALDLFKDKIAKLDTGTRQLVSTAACLGARFEAEELALAAAMPLADLYQSLAACFADNILLREKEQILFFHDQVQAAAESFMDRDMKRQVHQQIAEALLKAIPPQADLENLPNLFSIVEHLYEGRPEHQSDAQRLREARLNYHAGIMAMKALAMENANFFFSQSRELSRHLSWDKHYEFLFSLHKYLARTEMALGYQPESEQILNILIEEAKSDLDRVDCLYEQTTGLSSMGKFKQAIELGNRGLRLFGRAIPEDDDEALTKSAQIIEQIHHDNQDVWQQILDIRPSGDRATRIETGIYSELIPDYYLAGMVPQLYLAAIQSTQNCLAGGVDETVIYGFSMVGLYLQRQGRYEMSFRYEDLGLALSERYPDTFGATKGINGILWTNMHNRRGSEYIIEQCRKNIHRGKGCGDLYNAGLSYGPYIWHLIHQGKHLDQVGEIAAECIAFSEKFNLSLSLGLAQSAVAGWCDPMVNGEASYTEADIAAMLAKWELDKHVVSIGGYYTLKGISHHYLGNFRKAEQALERARPYLRGLSDNILNRLWYVFRYVNGLRLYSQPSVDEERILRECTEQVESWAALGPILQPYRLFMSMEQAFHQDDFSNCRRYCLDALDRAVEQEYTLLQAYLKERLGQLYIRHRHDQAGMHLLQAARDYYRCSAMAKYRQLQERYSLSLQEEQGDAEQSLALMLDVNYLLQATRAITQQLDLNLLLSTILKSVMERLGARTGYFVLAEQQLQVVARGIKRDQVEVEISEEGNLDTTSLSWAVVNYVYRTREMLVLENACDEGDFMTDETVQQLQLKSILCMPLLIQQTVLGVLYLENKLIKAVFTREQVELTKLLTAQAAIALQNTRLVRDMKQSQWEIESLNKELEKRVQERTDELYRANEELKNFAYVVSHDLKAPLRAINQLAGWLEEDYAGQFDEEGREQMALLRGRAKRMHEMIDGILQYSRVGRVRDMLEPVDVGQLVEDVIQLISPPEKIKIRIRPPLPVIKGEKVRLYQIFQNLLDNAVKYNDKEQGLVEVSCREERDYWRFCVADNGPGIDKKYQEKVFQLFQTLQPKDQSQSTGIGLSLIEKIVDSWGGKIWIESEAGQGCSILFTIPKIITIKDE